MTDAGNFSTLELDILRHGECEGGDIFRGATDVCVSAKGFDAMAQATRKANVNWDVVLSSPLQRCQMFAEHIARKKEIDCVVEEGLREMHFGTWEGRLVDEVWRTEPESLKAWSADPMNHPPPEGEHLTSVLERVKTLESSILAKYPNKKLLLVSHGGVIRVLLSRVLGMPMSKLSSIDVPYASITKIQYSLSRYGERVKLLAHNYATL